MLPRLRCRPKVGLYSLLAANPLFLALEILRCPSEVLTEFWRRPAPLHSGIGTRDRARCIPALRRYAVRKAPGTEHSTANPAAVARAVLPDIQRVQTGREAVQGHIRQLLDLAHRMVRRVPCFQIKAHQHGYLKTGSDRIFVSSISYHVADPVEICQISFCRIPAHSIFSAA